MAFDLNKKDTENKSFNLSKKDTAAPTAATEKSSGINLTKGAASPASNNVEPKRTAPVTSLSSAPAQESSSEGQKSKGLFIGVTAAVVFALGAGYYFMDGDKSTAQANPMEQTESTPITSGAEDNVQSDAVVQGTADAADQVNTTEGDVQNLNGSEADQSASTFTEADEAEANSHINANSSFNNSSTTAAPTSTTKTGNTASTSSNTDVVKPVSTAANFGSGSSSPSQVNDAYISDLVKTINENSNARINVSGFASSEGNFAFNQALSQERAVAFKNLLVSKGISANRIQAVGRGIDNPVASNETETGRIKNRRVEVEILD